MRADEMSSALGACEGAVHKLEIINPQHPAVLIWRKSEGEQRENEICGFLSVKKPPVNDPKQLATIYSLFALRVQSESADEGARVHDEANFGEVVVRKVV